MTSDKNKREVLDWAEQAGMEAVRDGLAGIDDIKAQARHVLALVTTAGGAAFAFVIHQLATQGWSAAVIGVVAMGTYLYLIGALIILLVLRMRRSPSVTNDPEILAKPEHTLEWLKEAEIKNIQRRIERIGEIQASMAKPLNCLLFALLFAPAIFFIAYRLSV